MRIRLILMMLMVAGLLGCSNEAYEQAMADGQAALKKADYQTAIAAFKQALKEEKNNKKVKIVLKQTQTTQNANEKLLAAEFDHTRDLIEQVMEEDNGADVLVDQAGDMQKEIEALEGKYERYTAVYDDAEAAFAKKQFDESIELIDDVLDEKMTHAMFVDLHGDFEKLLEDVKDKKEAVEKQARKRREVEDKAPIEEKKGQNDEQGEATAKQEEQGNLDALVGYWLNTEENIAAHIAESYMVTAMPNSDFVTNDELSTIEPVSTTEFMITYADGNQGAFTLTHNKTILTTPGLTFKSVSKKEANAIFDGHYELP